MVRRLLQSKQYMLLTDRLIDFLLSSALRPHCSCPSRSNKSTLPYINNLIKNKSPFCFIYLQRLEQSGQMQNRQFRQFDILIDRRSSYNIMLHYSEVLRSMKEKFGFSSNKK